MTAAAKILPLLLLLLSQRLHAQQLPGTGGELLLSAKYVREVRHKSIIYQHRIRRKTEKTLVRLAKWETRIQHGLHDISPETEQTLFADPKLTFQYLLKEYRQAVASVEKRDQHYDAYLDQISTTTAYLEEQSQTQQEQIARTREQIATLKKQAVQTEYIRALIQKRKRQLLSESLHYLGKSKALQRISKGSYYYTEALNNYKALFSEPGKAEEAVTRVLNEIPAFQSFVRQNSQLASMFRIPGSGNPGGGNNTNAIAALAGLQTRVGVQAIVRQRIAAGGPNAVAQVQQNLSEAQTQLSSLKDKLLDGGIMGSDGEVDMPGFKPNGQRSKTLWQRLEYGVDLQFAKNDNYLPSTTDLGVSLGYRLNDRSTIGVGVSYKLGFGSIDDIKITSEGMGLRSYLDWRIKGQWYAAGGYELNYMSVFKDVSDLKDVAWQRSGLVGISRQYRIGKKRTGEAKLMYDFLYRQHVPQGMPVVFRMGYQL